jgi:hypothetical protein
MLPCVRITDLMSEVARGTVYPDGRASVALLCAQMRPLREVEYHQM